MSEEEAQLRQLGYRQELLRSLGGFSNFAISFSVISILTGGITLYGYGLKTAGPLGILLGWVVVSLFSLPLVFSMAELASAFPTAGALYHWASFLGNRQLGWFTAWLNYLGQFAITAGIDYGLADFLVSLLGLTSSPTTLYFIYALLLLSHGLINHFGIRWVDFFNHLSAWYHVAGVVVLVACLAFFAPLNPLTFLSTPITTTSFPYFYAFCLALLQAQWTITGYDASAHVAEETLHGSAQVPVGMITSVVSSAVLGFLMLAVITLAIPDLTGALQATNPFIYIMQSALGPSLGNAMVWLCVIAMWFCGLSSLTSNSRMLFAFARDKGVPFHEQIAKVSPRYKTPTFAIWISAILAFLLALYGRAYEVVAAISTVLILASYFLPVFAAERAQRLGLWQKKGPFRLGKYSLLCNRIACAWIVFILVVLLMPPNYLTLYGTVVALLSLVALYFSVARGRFEGVVCTTSL